MQGGWNFNNQECYFDSHTHLLDFDSKQLPNIIHQAHQKSVFFISSNTTHQKQYEPMLQLAQQFTPHLAQLKTVYSIQDLQLHKGRVTIIPSFGIHPCYVHKQTNNLEWELILQKLLQTNHYFGVGQIGLDYRTSTLETTSKQQQFDFFNKQFELALRLNRTVTVHCVRAYGELLKFFKQHNKKIELLKKKPELVEQEWTYKHSPIIMHSYGGSKEITESLLKLTNLNIYFSLSLKRSEELCTIIPIQKLLLQTDAPYQPNMSLLQQQKIEEINFEQEGKSQKMNRVEYVRANVPSLCHFYGLERTSFAKMVFLNSLKVFKLLA